MNFTDVIHIPIIAFIHLGLMYLWNLKMRNRVMKTKKIWVLTALGALFNVWGLDVVQRDFGVDTIPNMLKLSAGCWLVFAVATGAKYYAVYGWSKREFWLDYGGDLVAFLISGVLIFAAT